VLSSYTSTFTFAVVPKFAVTCTLPPASFSFTLAHVIGATK
jgi:hypothetical protein